MAEQQLDDLRQFDSPKETQDKLPIGWLILFFGLIAWGVWYLWTFTPGLGGWSQVQDLEGGGAPTGVNMLATIAFTAIPATAAVALILVQRRKGKKQAP